MIDGLVRTIRFAHAWTTVAPECQEEEVELGGPQGGLRASRFRRPGGEPGPSWVLLHGMTRTGRQHTSLTRFARSLAGTGATVLIPEVPEWVSLRLAPDRTPDAVEAAVASLEGDPSVMGPPGLMGFSFGGPQALRVSTLPGLAGRLACVASFGGYGELEDTLHFLMTGVSVDRGRERRIRPDPYGRWIVAANYLTRVPGYADAGPVAEGLRALAAYAGDHNIESWDPRMDGLKSEIEAGLPPRWAGLFRYFAPPSREDPPGATECSSRWIRSLSRAGLATDPELNVPEVLEIPCPTYLVHGWNDHLIPVSQLFHLARRVRAPRLEVTVTRLFGHSAGDPRPRGLSEWSRELRRLGGTLARLFAEP